MQAFCIYIFTIILTVLNILLNCLQNKLDLLGFWGIEVMFDRTRVQNLEWN